MPKHNRFILRTALILLYASLQCMLLSGCEPEAVPTLSEADFDATDTTVTATGISVGDSLEAFLASYGDYPLLVSADGGDYAYTDRDALSAGQELSVILDTFFIDREAMSIDEICTAYEIEKENFLETMNSESFLSSHTVVYRYIVFTFSGGSITDITSDYRDFNAEYAYDTGRS